MADQQFFMDGDEVHYHQDNTRSKIKHSVENRAVANVVFVGVYLTGI